LVARSLGPELASGYLQNILVRFVGPLAGALMAGIAFRLVKHRYLSNAAAEKIVWLLARAPSLSALVQEKVKN
jgi:hypothetical protein